MTHFLATMPAAPLGRMTRESSVSWLSAAMRYTSAATARTPILLGRALDVSLAFVLGLQMDHDLAVAALAMQRKDA